MKKKKWIVFTIIAVIYLITLPGTVQIGDSAELITASLTDSLSHPPGYNLYLVLTRTLSILIPIANKGLLFNFFSLLFTLFGLLFLLKTVELLFKKEELLFAAIPIFFIAPFWENSTVAEVYPLYFALLSLGFYLFVSIIKGKKKFLPLYFFISGLGMIAHQMYIFFFLPSFIILLLRKDRFKITYLLLLLFPFLLHLYPIFRAEHASTYVWSSPNNLRKFLFYFFRGQYEPIYGNFHLILDKMRYLYKIFIVNWGIIFTLLLTFFLLFIKRKKDQIINYTFIFFIFSFPFIILLIPADYTFRKVEIFFQYIPSIIPFGLILFIYLLDLLKRKVYIIIVSFISILFFILSGPNMLFRDSGFYEKYGYDLLSNLPKNSTLIVKGDNPTFSTVYLKYVKHLREDITIISRNDILKQSIKLKKNPQKEIELFDTTENIYYSSLTEIDHINTNLIPCNLYYAKNGSECKKVNITLKKYYYGTALSALISTYYYFLYLRNEKNDHLKAAMKFGKHNAGLFYNLGYFSYRKGAFKDAVKYTEQGYRIEKNPYGRINLFGIYIFYSQTLFKDKKYQEALICIDKAEKIMDNPSIYFYRGVIYDRMGYVEMSRENLEKFISSDYRDNKKMKVARSILENKE